jgi:hypothetical protein
MPDIDRDPLAFSRPPPTSGGGSSCRFPPPPIPSPTGSHQRARGYPGGIGKDLAEMAGELGDVV